MVEQCFAVLYAKQTYLACSVPVPLMFFDRFCKHGVDRTMSSLDRCIRHRPIGGASEILDTHHSGQMLQNRVYKLRPIIMDLQLAGAVYQIDVFQQCIRDCKRSFVSERNHHKIFGETTDSCQQVDVSTSTSSVRSSQINMELFGTAQVRLRFSWHLAAVLDLFCIGSKCRIVERIVPHLVATPTNMHSVGVSL